MPGSTFVLGYDTAIRVLNPKYYEGEAGLVRALSEIREHGCRFVVGGRADEVRPAHTFPGGGGGCDEGPIGEWCMDRTGVIDALRFILVDARVSIAVV